jgi:hypothetical protein
MWTSMVSAKAALLINAPIARPAARIRIIVIVLSD